MHRSDHQPRRRKPPKSRARFVLPVAAVGILVACGGALFYRGPEQATVSEVARTIRELALAAGAPGAAPYTGQFGPWAIRAGGVDPVSGELLDFRVESGPMIIGAARADVRVNAVRDTVSLDLRDVTFSRVPEDDANGEAYLHHMDHHELGPFAYGIDIVPDRTIALR